MISPTLYIKEMLATIETQYSNYNITATEKECLANSLYNIIDEDAMNLDTMDRTNNVVSGCRVI